MKTLRYNLLDVFTDTRFAGNPLAVFTQARDVPGHVMQLIAREMNLSETVFFLPPEQGGHAKIRIFTPRTELPFAGHPVLGAAWVLGAPLVIPRLVLETGRGLIEVDLEREGDVLSRGFMTQPLPERLDCPVALDVEAALGLSRAERSGRLPTVLYDNGPRHVLVEVANEHELDDLRPDFSMLARLRITGVLVFCQHGLQAHARYFAPAEGILEDPATGSANGPLGAHLLFHERIRSGEQLVVEQGRVMGRPSTLLVDVLGTPAHLERVRVGGSAVVCGRGELVIG